MLKSLTGMIACILMCPPVFAETAQDCIGLYNDLKSEFVAVSGEFSPECTKSANAFGLFNESNAGDLPAHCDPRAPGAGGWDHWHLEARGVVGKESYCSLTLRGLAGQEGCGTEEIVMELPNNEAAHWRNFLRKECKKIGK